MSKASAEGSDLRGWSLGVSSRLGGRLSLRGAARLLAFAATAASLCAGMSCKSDEDAPRQVVLYCSADQAVAEPIVAEFERGSGIKVLARYDTESSKTVGLVQRLRAEQSSPAADVFWSSEVFYTIRLAREGLLAPFEADPSSGRAKQLVGPKGVWHGFALRGRVIAYSTARVGPDEAPHRLEDVLDARWKGRIVMAAPEFGTTGGDVASWFAHYGQQRAEQILAGLKANDIRLVDGNSTAVRMVATGQADVCFTDTDDVYAAKRNGWPVAMNFLNQGDDGALAIPNTAAVIRGGPHPREAVELMRFLLGKRVETILAESDSHNSPTHALLTGRYAQYEIPNPLATPYEDIADALPTALTTAGEILR